jgi:phenylalanyl-tRNA synthetase alpha chain
VLQNFDSLGFPADHPGRSKTDTYYINKDTVLRTHTSAHQADIFAASESEGFTVAADVYRRDAIDRSHYPVFHQMEGARMWSRSEVPGGGIAAAVWADLEKLPKHNLVVQDSGPVFHKDNPLQPEHSAEECEAIAAHLKRSLEGVVVEVFGQAKKAAIAAREAKEDDAPLQVRWIEAYFPFTSPSWELEVFWQGEWLELLGCGVVKQSLPNNAGTDLSLDTYKYC